MTITDNKPKKKCTIDPFEFHFVVEKLRKFFNSKGFIDVPTQSRLSILAACEDPSTIAQVKYAKQEWPLPQTGQMWLEHELLNYPNAPGFFCLTTSYRQEQNPVEGRHELVFPLFEFETHGGMDKLMELERELLEFLGFGKKESFPEGNYVDVAKNYGVTTLENEQEEQLEKDHGSVFFLKNFPIHTSPFWNMHVEDGKDYANKVDVIICGIETIGSAERSIDKKKMRNMFDTISDGAYAKILYEKFGEERVEKEMEEFLSYDFFKRCGGGIGMTRLIRAMKKCGLLEKSEYSK
jgi:aspartyl/asparaginyl-tRNA synthetase